MWCSISPTIEQVCATHWHMPASPHPTALVALQCKSQWLCSTHRHTDRWTDPLCCTWQGSHSCHLHIQCVQQQPHQCNVPKLQWHRSQNRDAHFLSLLPTSSETQQRSVPKPQRQIPESWDRLPASPRFPCYQQKQKHDEALHGVQHTGAN